MSAQTDPLPRRRRHRPTELPVVLRPRTWLPVVLAALLVWAGWFAYASWRAGRASLRLVAPGGERIAAAQLDFFAFDESGGGPSPTTKLGTVHAEAAEIEVGPELVPGGEALVRVHAEGQGITYTHLEAGRPPQVVRLGEPRVLHGIVRWIAAAPEEAAIAGARVEAYGGGPRGVLLDTTTTAADGTFVIDALASSVHFVTFRVFAPGFAVFEEEVPSAVELPPFELVRTLPVAGRVLAPAGCDVADLELRVFHLPGVTARTGPDGAFTIDHLPPAPTRCALLAASLPPGHTHLRCIVQAGDRDVRLVVEPEARVRGVVVDGVTRAPLRNVKLFHEHGPAGMEIVDCDDAGRFEIGRVPPGLVRLTADVLVQRLRIDRNGQRRFVRDLRRGATDVEARAGATIEDVVVLVEPAGR